MRRNWPDLLIGIALVAVIAGIIVTLLGGGSVFDFARSPRPATPEPRPAATAPQLADEPVSPLGGARTAEDEPPGEGTATGDVLIPVPPNEAAAPPAGPGAGEGAGTTITPVPPGGAAAPTVTTPVTPMTTAPAEATPAAPTTTVPTTTAPTTAPTTTAPTPAAGAATTPEPALTQPGEQEAAAGAEEPWRIVTGTFRQRENAERLAAEYRAEGHPVFVATQDDLSYVVVGPFADEAQTRSLAQQFRDAGREADVRVLATEGAATATAPAATTTPAATTPTTTAPTATTPTTPTTTAPATPQAQTPPAPAAAQPQAGAGAPGARYIQAGAYRTAESAAPQRERLEALGYQVTSSTTDTGLIRLLIGPFGAEEAENVRRRLDAQGIEHAPGPTATN